MYPIEAPSPITSLHFFPAPGPEQTDHCIQNKDPDLLSRHRAEKATEKPRKTAKSCKTLPFGTYGKEIKITCQKVRNTCTQAQIGRTMHQELRFLLLIPDQANHTIESLNTISLYFNFNPPKASHSTSNSLYSACRFSIQCLRSTHDDWA